MSGVKIQNIAVFVLFVLIGYYRVFIHINIRIAIVDFEEIFLKVLIIHNLIYIFVVKLVNKNKVRDKTGLPRYGVVHVEYKPLRTDFERAYITQINDVILHLSEFFA
jgi:hypothetical protein